MCLSQIIEVSTKSHKQYVPLSRAAVLALSLSVSTLDDGPEKLDHPFGGGMKALWQAEGRIASCATESLF